MFVSVLSLHGNEHTTDPVHLYYIYVCCANPQFHDLGDSYTMYQIPAIANPSIPHDTPYCW